MPTSKAIPLCVFVFLILCPSRGDAVAGRIGLYGIRMEPRGDGSELSDTDWGFAVDGALPIPRVHRILAADLGFEYVNFATKTTTLQPDPFSFARTLQTDQDFFRFALGLQAGPHGPGFFQPYAAIHGAVVTHSLRSTLEESFDQPDMTRSQTSSTTDWGVGYDIAAGANLNFRNRFGFNAGVKWLQNFGLNELLGDLDRPLDPKYFQVFAGITFDLGYLESLDDGPADMTVDYVGSEYPPTTEVEVHFGESRPDRSSEEIGELVVRAEPDASVTASELQLRVVEEAKLRGADAVVLEGLEASGTTLRAVLLKYTEP